MLLSLLFFFVFLYKSVSAKQKHWHCLPDDKKLTRRLWLSLCTLLMLKLPDFLFLTFLMNI